MNRWPEVVFRGDQPYVTIPIEVTSREWRRANALFGELFDWLERRGIEIAGPPFFRYWVIDGTEAKFGLEAGVPVASAVEGDGRVFADTIRGGAYATLVHEGPPDRLPESRAMLREWAAREGVRLDRIDRDGWEVWGGLYEFHLADPTEARDPSRNTTEIACRVRETNDP